MGRTFYATPREIRVTSSVIEATLASVQSGGTATYSYLDFVNAAQTALNKVYTAANYQTITSLSNVTQVASTVYYGTGTGANTIYYNNGSGQGTLYFTAKSVFGTAQYTAYVTAKTSGGSSQTYTVTFSIPVSPTKVTYEDQYPTPVTSGNSYYYYVQVPNGYTSYYVLGTPNQATEPNWALTGRQYSGSDLYYLTDSNFVNGKCTLWLITKDSYNRYSCGQLTVYQQNNDIQYNGVAGETVKFSHSDFTKFMNAMNTASSTYYYEFQDVTFSYFNNTTQGALYYNNTAMSSGSYASSSYFNSATKITNLDYVSFAVNAKIPSSVKEIVVPFQMHVKQYYSRNGYPTSSGQTVTLSGRVVISVVREDVKLTVAPGDAVKMDADAFLSYLRSSSNAYRNASIDYVTFEQTSSTNASSIYSGTLYSYYNSGYSVGSQVKSSDKFYYTTSYYNQNALSDVAFYASPYATTGSTVYIPFTIKPTYGSAVSGTLAVKIAQTMNFVDVKPGSVYYDAVKWAVNQKVTTGTGAYTFSPDKTCTRAEIVTFLYRAAGGSTQSSYYYTNPFTDVGSSMGSDFYNAILWAVNKGITTGTSKTTFSPNKTCTRAEIVTFLYRYAGNNATGYYSNPFTDVKQTTHAPYYNAILWAVGKGITTGTTATTFSPDKTCTRGEAVTFLYRAIGK